MTDRRIWTNKITMQRSDHDLPEYENGAFAAPFPRLIIFPLSFYRLLIHYLAKPLYFSVKPYTIWRNLRLLPKSLVLPNCANRYVISGIKKPQKERLTNHSGEPLQA